MILVYMLQKGLTMESRTKFHPIGTLPGSKLTLDLGLLWKSGVVFLGCF